MRAALFGLIVSCGGAHAAAFTLPATFKTKPLRIIVTVPAGGSVDNATRAMSLRLSERHGFTVVIDNRPGGTGAIAMTLTAQAACARSRSPAHNA